MSVYDIVTKKIIEQLEKGIIPWQRPWKQERPRNIKGRPYKGVNLLLLANTPYSCPIWATFRQIKERGGSVKAGERGTLVVFYKPEIEYVIPKGMNEEEFNRALILGELDESELEVKETHWLLRYYKVFNLEQTTLEIEKYWQPVSNNFLPIEQAEKIVENMPTRPAIIHKGSVKAAYYMDIDTVQMPHKEHFHSPEGYYETLFHELTHSTGHPKRLNRKSLTAYSPFGGTEYSKEELVAELGSAFLCSECGIEQDIQNKAAYIQSWLQALRNDKRMIVVASSQAQKAADYILGGRHGQSQDN